MDDCSLEIIILTLILENFESVKDRVSYVWFFFFFSFWGFTTNTQNIVGLALYPNVLLDDEKTSKGNVGLRATWKLNPLY